MKPNVFDCTLRDGGYVNNWGFTKEQVRECYKGCSNAGVEYMEIGFRNFKTEAFLKKYGETFFCTEDYLNEVVGDIDGCKVAVMVTINAFDMDEFIPASESKISMVRVLMAYHGFKNETDEELDMQTLKDGVKQIEKLHDLGYEVCFNIGRIDKLTREQLYTVCELISQTNIKLW